MRRARQGRTVATETSSRLASVFGILLLSALASPAYAGSVALLQGAGGTFQVPVRSLKESRFQSVVRQQNDFSCGSAAVATLLTYHYQIERSESEVFKTMFERGDKTRIKKDGFSLLDMKRYLDSSGFRADGFRLPLDRYAKLGIPGIVLLNINGYSHFVVIKGVRENEVLIGDPALGLRVIPRADFEKQWRGVVLMVRNRSDIGRAHFNQLADWKARRKSPFGIGVDRDSIADFNLMLPTRSDF